LERNASVTHEIETQEKGIGKQIEGTGKKPSKKDKKAPGC
jgi:hypothetical protein